MIIEAILMLVLRIIKRYQLTKSLQLGAFFGGKNMNNSLIKSEVEAIIFIHTELLYKLNAKGKTMKEETLCKYAEIVYKQINRPEQNATSSEDAYKPKKDTKEVKKFNFNVPEGQLLVKGARCIRCGKNLMESKKGNVYCQCFYETVEDDK
jgi:hypothetical protein